jgi:hypothetical protein
MIRTLLALATVALLLLSLLLAPVQRKATAQSQTPQDPAGIEVRGGDGNLYRTENPIKGQYIVVISSDYDLTEDTQIAYDLAANYSGTVLEVPYLDNFNRFSISMKEEAAIALSRDSSVQFVEEMPEGGLEAAPAEPQLEEDVQIPDPDPETEFEIVPGPNPGGETISGVPTETTPSVGELISPLPVSSEILKRADPPNDHYFLYGKKIVQLFGMSGSYLPHVNRDRARNNGFNPVRENCTGDMLGSEAKYQKCIQLLKQNGLNHFQIWVTLNHSVGMLPIEAGTGANGNQPYPHEQPFTRTNGKWNILAPLDADFFTNLKNVVQYAQNQRMIVGVVLFDPWSGWVGNQPARSAWYAPNNRTNAQVDNSPGIGFTNPNFFVQGDNPNANGDTGEIDSPANSTNPNWVLRNRQVDIMSRAATELSSLNNFYWVLANEPDMDGKVSGKGLINWHKYMARRLWTIEDGLSHRHHLIAANLASNDPNTAEPANPQDDDAITALSNYSKIDIITGHYTFLRTDKGQVSQAERYSAIKLITTYNDYENNGAPKAFNKKLFGMVESRPTGTGEDDVTNARTADAARVEAWEFFFDGGGLFDHLSYRWANPNDTDNLPVPKDVLRYYSYLSAFLNPISLDGMKRTTLNQTNRWLTSTANPAPHWAAMSNTSGVYLLYLHRSGYSNLYNQDRYQVNTTTEAASTIDVQKLGRGCYKAEWYYPDGKKVDNFPTFAPVSGNILQPVSRQDFGMAGTESFTLTRPKYKQDLVLKVTKKTQFAYPQFHPGEG